jgi:integrase
MATNAELALKMSTVKYYDFQLARHITPALGSCSICELNRAHIEALLSTLKQKGHASATIRGVRATVSTVLQSAVERGYLEKNAAHGIRVRQTTAKLERRFYTPAQVRQLLPELTEPRRTVVQIAVLTGLRIGEIFALRWKRVDLLRGTLEVAETFSDGVFGLPKTRSSNRVLPMSEFLVGVLETHRTGNSINSPEGLVFRTRTGTPLSSKNLYNRELAPACDRIKQPRVSWHSFRHTHATLLADVGESIKTAQSLLGHSDLGTTLNTYAHVLPGSQRRAVERVAGVLFSDVLKLEDSAEDGQVN